MTEALDEDWLKSWEQILTDRAGTKAEPAYTLSFQAGSDAFVDFQPTADGKRPTLNAGHSAFKICRGL